MNKHQVYVVYPEGMTFENWANAVIMSMNGLIITVPPPEEENWREWARSVISNSHVTEHSPPSPDEFNTWYEWARLFVQSLGPAGL